MIAYFYFLFLGSWVSFIGTFSHTIGIGPRNPYKISRCRNQSKSNFTAYASNVNFAHIITAGSGFTSRE
jgi:hypothetical protein